MERAASNYRKTIKRLGRHDGLFQWGKGYQQSKILSAKQWRRVPAQITVRILRFDALIRCLMAQAVSQAGVEMERLSFKGTVDAVRQFAPAFHGDRSNARRRQIWRELIRTITRDLVPLRPHRQEPRAVKRRPKAYQLLNKPRHHFNEVPHRCRYYNKNNLKNRGLI